MNILLITQGYWTPQLGAVKVHIDLKDEYERQGHTVDVISANNFYPKGETILSTLFGATYPSLIHRILKKCAYKYDVIDANIKCVPYPKNSFNFKGLLLARSHGIDPVYNIAEREILSFKEALEDDRKKSKSLKTRLGNLYRFAKKEVGQKEFDLSVAYADIVHCLNNAEYEYFLKQGIPAQKLVTLPNGIPDEFIHSMNAQSTFTRDNSISFIGSWTIRKGIKDLDRITSSIGSRVFLKEVLLLGGHTASNIVLHSFRQTPHNKLKVVSTFGKNDLLNHLKFCKAGIFPSFVEGFGLAVVEQLACGIPVVAYNVPGPADILRRIDESLLIEPGNLNDFVNKVVDIMTMDSVAYTRLSEKCKERSRDFLLSHIAIQFIDIYQSGETLTEISSR